MQGLITVIKFTIKDMAQRKSFIISNIIILGLIILMFNIPNILKKVMGDSENSKQIIQIIDVDNVFEGTLENLKNMNLSYDIKISSKNLEFDKIKEEIQNGEIDNAIIIEKKDEKINIQYIVKNLAMNSEMPQDLENAISSLYSGLQISKLGLTQEQLRSIQPDFNFEVKQAETQEVKGNIYTMMLLSIVLFYAIYFCAYQVSSSITTEKTSKIIETLVTSTEPKTIVLGKTIGIGIVGVLQIIAIALTAIVSKTLFLEEGALDGIVDFSTITPFLGCITIIYFILGYAFFAMLYALTGSTVSKPEDVQSANTPVALISVIGFYLAYFTMMNPTSELNKIAAILPISSPFCMPFRVMMEIATGPEILGSIVILIITTILVAIFSIKIYSKAIFNYGSRVKIKELLRNEKKGARKKSVLKCAILHGKKAISNVQERKEIMKRKENLIWGVVFIIIGLIIGLKVLGIINIDIFFDGWWSLFIIIPSTISIVKNIRDIGAYIWLVIGVALLLSAQEILDMEIVGKLIFPAVLVAIGVGMIFKESKLEKAKENEEYYATFSGEKLNFEGNTFNGASLNAIFGGIDLNLKKADITNETNINATSVFGGINIFVPDNVNVEIKSTSLFGGVTNKVENKENQPTIKIRTFCLFGGVEVK